MYEENENKIQWGAILKKIGMILVVIIVIFGIVALVNKCSKKEVEEPPQVPTKVNLESQLDKLEKATLEYISEEKLPVGKNNSKTIRLKTLMSANLVDELVDEENNVCDSNDSFSEITQLDTNYAIKMILTCKDNKASRVVYVGCFESCQGGICKGEESQENGLCGASAPSTDEKDSTNNNKPQQTTTTSNNGSSFKPSTNPSINTKPNTNTNTSTSSNSNGAFKPVLYELKKCETVLTCKTGTTLNSNGECETTKNVTLESKVIKSGGETKTTTTTVFFKNPADAKNTSTVKYTFVKITSSGTYQYTKTTTTTTPVTYSCADSRYTYNSSTGKCTRVQSQKVLTPAIKREECITTWSFAPDVPGWTRTGRTK